MHSAARISPDLELAVSRTSPRAAPMPSAISRADGAAKCSLTKLQVRIRGIRLENGALQGTGDAPFSGQL